MLRHEIESHLVMLLTRSCGPCMPFGCDYWHLCIIWSQVWSSMPCSQIIEVATSNLRMDEWKFKGGLASSMLVMVEPIWWTKSRIWDEGAQPGGTYAPFGTPSMIHPTCHIDVLFLDGLDFCFVSCINGCHDLSSWRCLATHPYLASCLVRATDELSFQAVTQGVRCMQATCPVSHLSKLTIGWRTGIFRQ